MKYYLSVFLIVVFLLSNAQHISKFGSISTKELEMTEYEKDLDAEAVILFDVGKSKFIDTEEGGYDILFSRHKRIKIFKKSGLEFSEISIPYYENGYGKEEQIVSLEAFTYTLVNGIIQKQPLDKTTVYTEKINQRWRNAKFIFPNVQEGAVIEYNYTLRTPFHFNLPDWTFQDKIPTVYSEYEVRMIPFYEYVFRAQGISKFDFQKSVVDRNERKWGNVGEARGTTVGSGVIFKDFIHSYALKDIPAFKDESYISSINDYIIKIDFQLAKFNNPNGIETDIISTWSKLNKNLMKNDDFGKYIKNASKYAKKIVNDEIDLNGLSPNEKCEKLIGYVKENFTWNGFNNKYASQSTKDFLKSKVGNSADINLFLIALLQKAEIETYPVVLSTRNHGKIQSDYPFDHYTNYVIPLIYSEQTFLTDGTQQFLSYDKLPPKCINERGLVVNDKEEVEWVELSNTASSIKRSFITLNIIPESFEITYDCSIQSTGFEAYSYRKNLENNFELIEDYFKKKVGSIDSIGSTGYDSPSRPYIITLNGTYEIDKIGDNLVINPFLNLPISENKLTEKKRNYPVDFVYPKKEEFEINISIPEGYKLSQIPEDLNIENVLVEVRLSYDENNGILKIKGIYHFKKAIYVSSEYSRIKYYLDTIVKNFNPKIVFEKS